MAQIKVDSRVRCTSAEEDDPVLVGDIGTVIEFSCSVAKVLWDVPRVGMYRSAKNVYSMTDDELEEI